MSTAGSDSDIHRSGLQTDGVRVQTADLVRANARVAVVGAGMAGMACASRLIDLGVDVTVIEMGRGAGGRAATRREKVGDHEICFDHGVQYFSATTPKFREMCKKWEDAKVVLKWEPEAGTLDAVQRTFTSEKAVKSCANPAAAWHDEWHEGQIRYVGNPSSNSICKAMSTNIEDRCIYSTRVTGMDQCDEGWWLRGRHRRDPEAVLGCFTVVIWSAPSNGHEKWNRLYGMPPPISAEKAPVVAPILASIESAPCFTVMLAFDRPMAELPFDINFVKRSDKLCKAVRNSSKPLRAQLLPHGWETWVLLSTTSYAREMLSAANPGAASDVLLDRVAEEMVAEFKYVTALRFQDGAEMPAPIFAKGHRWGAAYPATILDQPVLIEPERRMIACGDFCLTADIEGAAMSGLAAAEAAFDILKEDRIKNAHKIVVTNPIVEIDGDEMTKVLWQMVKTKLLLPFLDLNLECYDLGIANRDQTDDRVTKMAAEAIKRCNVGVKCQTITPNAKWVAELGLKRMYPSPNTTIRSILGGTIVREPFTCSSIPQLIPGWMEPVIVCRHAVADHTEAAEIDVQGPGMVEIFFTSADGEARRCATLSDYRLRRQDV